jgi:hypothetical protein
MFTIGSCDFSTEEKRLPLIDFALSLKAVVQVLSDGAGEETLRFTENEDEITFKRLADDLAVTASYATRTATTPFAALRVEADHFGRRLSRDLEMLFPQLLIDRNAGELLSCLRT